MKLISGRDVLDSEDFIVRNLLLSIGSLIYLMFCVTKWIWDFDNNYLKEINTSSGIKISAKLKLYFQFMLPILTIVIWFQELIQ